MFSDFGNQIIDSFNLVEAALNKLCLHIHDELTELPLWVSNGAEGFENNRDKVIFALKHFGPSEGLKPQETSKYPGVVACNQNTIELIREVNEAKDALKKIIAMCRADIKHATSDFVRDTLARAGYPAIKLKQVLRHIKSINYHPRRISWTQGKHNSSKTLSKKETENLLMKTGQGEHIQIQLIKLSMLDGKSVLVKHRDIKPCLVANIATFKQGTRSNNEDIRTSLPIFYIHDRNLINPTVCFSDKISRNMKARADKRIEDSPFLPSISAYRYKV